MKLITLECGHETENDEIAIKRLAITELCCIGCWGMKRITSSGVFNRRNPVIDSGLGVS